MNCKSLMMKQNLNKIESSISDFKAERIKEKLKNGKLWEILKDEQLSSAFCSIGKVSNVSESLSCIKDNNGKKF